MAIITSYSTLLTEIATWCARSDITSAVAAQFVQNWEENFYLDADNWASWMEAALSVSITSGVAAVPSDYLGLRVAYIDGSAAAPLKRVSLDQLYQRFPRDGTTGTPKYISRNGSNFEFGPIATTGTLAGTYFAKPTVLRSYTTGGADAVSHPLILNAPQLLLFGSLLEAEPWLKNDKRIPLWQARYGESLNAYRKRYKEEDYSGSPPAAVAV